MPLNMNNEVSIRLKLNDINQIISAVNGYYQALISNIVEQANEQSKESEARPRPQVVTNEGAC